MKNLLLLDDDPLIHKVAELALADRYRLLSATTFAAAIELLEKEEIDGAITDINLKDPEHDGVEFLERFKAKYPEKPVLMESGYRDVDTVVRCMKLGADDYLEKPFDENTLLLKLQKVFNDTKRLSVYRRAFDKTQAVHQIVGVSAQILAAKDKVEKAQGLRILFYGETGTGKTPFAYHSNRVVSQIEGVERPFEQVNCSSLNTEQLQDQLFGHKKGAFTGAIADKRGLVEIAKGGDLFLDEIGDMPLETQAQFLTFLDSMEYYRLGDDKKRKADVRILCATNKDLKKMVVEGKFRQDLYSRISQVIVEIPPLRERLEDLESLVQHFVLRFCGYEKPLKESLLTCLKSFSWEEGNVRELRDAIEYACMMARSSECIVEEHLAEKYRPQSAQLQPAMEVMASAASVPENASDDHLLTEYGLEPYLEFFEKRLLQRKVKAYSGNLEHLAKNLRISRPTLYRRLKKYDIPTPRMES